MRYLAITIVALLAVLCGCYRIVGEGAVAWRVNTSTGEMCAFSATRHGLEYQIKPLGCGK